MGIDSSDLRLWSPRRKDMGMLSSRQAGITVAVNGNEPVPVHEWTLDAPPVEYVRSASAALPDPNWQHTDSNGHEHRWARTDRKAMSADDALPTLVRGSQHVDCDGSCSDYGCDGYEVTVWHCAACGEQIEPGYVPDYEAQTTGIPVQTGYATGRLMVMSLPDDVLTGAVSVLDLVVTAGGRRATARGSVDRVMQSGRDTEYTISAGFTSEWEALDGARA